MSNQEIETNTWSDRKFALMSSLILVLCLISLVVRALYGLFLSGVILILGVVGWFILAKYGRVDS